MSKATKSVKPQNTTNVKPSKELKETKQSSRQKKTQLTVAKDYDTDNMIFSSVQNATVPNTTIKYKRINISTINPDGTEGELVLPTERIFSFGLSESLNQATKALDGYSFPLCLWNKDGATEDEKAWTDTFTKIIERCKKHLVSVRDEIGNPELELRDRELKKIDPFYWGKKDAPPDPKRGPTLYPKVLVNKKNGMKITTIFSDVDGNPIEDPLSLIKKYCYTTAVVKVEGIYIGAKMSMQIKLYEAIVEPLGGAPQPLISRPKPKAITRVVTGDAENMNDMPDPEEEGGDGDDDKQVSPSRANMKGLTITRKVSGGSLAGSEDGTAEDAEQEEAPAPPPKKVFKKVIKKVVT